DMDEGNLDTDLDGTYDFLDTDSDGDTISDMLEAGDYDITTPPENCDTDTLPNYRDTDSDNDGISDADELLYGTDLCDPDTDGDGVSDLIEIAYGSDPLDSSESPRTYGDFVFEVPHMAAPSPTVDTLVFSTDIQKGDVFFLLDTTGSMGGELTNLRTSLSSTIIPGIASRIPDVWYAVGRHDDYPYGGYGSPSSGDVVFQLNQRTTSSTTLAQSAVNSLGLHYGVDGPESQVPALYATATGGGFGSYLAAQTSCATGERGYPCFRAGAVPIVILMTDATFHNGYGGTWPYSGVVPTPPNFATTVSALNAINAKVITVNSGGTYAQVDCTQITTQTGAVDVSGTPLYFEISSSGTGMGTAIIDAVETLISRVPIRVDAIVTDDPGDSVDAVTSFIDRVQTNTSGASIFDPATGTTRVCTTTATATPGTAPTVDYFTGVLPGQSVCYDIYPQMNTTIVPLTTPQIFRAVIDIIGDLFTPLDSRDIYFLVPPVIPGGN
ncbi:MAG: hypothetical protein JRG91_15950, partial [Deltaproteobacteria bacterium]|nr:hypothetical protein [Deltaproteobacteria bacterium]